MKILIIIMAFFLIIFEAIPEGLKDNGRKMMAGFFQFIYLFIISITIFSFLSGVCIPYEGKSLIKLIAGYGLLRYAIFDIIYNLSADNEIFFVGSTKMYDKIWQWFFKVTKFPAAHFLWLTKIMALALGLTWLIK